LQGKRGGLTVRLYLPLDIEGGRTEIRAELIVKAPLCSSALASFALIPSTFPMASDYPCRQSRFLADVPGNQTVDPPFWAIWPSREPILRWLVIHRLTNGNR
jgi:hypothetical protein